MNRTGGAALSHCSSVQTNNFRGHPTDADHRQHGKMQALFVGLELEELPVGQMQQERAP